MSSRRTRNLYFTETFKVFIWLSTQNHNNSKHLISASELLVQNKLRKRWLPTSFAKFCPQPKRMTINGKN
jgi:hypothetical protein